MVIRSAWGLGHPGRDGTDTGGRHELHGDQGGRVHLLQIEDELRQILDGADIVVGRRRSAALPGLQ